MVSVFNPVVAEGHPPIVVERAAPWFWRQSPSADRYRSAVENRIRRVFHLPVTRPLPLVCRNTLRDYQTYLARFLTFPFWASYWEEMEPMVVDDSVLATGLSEPNRTRPESGKGILCEVVFGNTVRLPLALLKVDPRSPNCRMIDDYWHWYWNCR